MQIRIGDVVTMPGRACEGKVRSAAIAPGRYEVAVVEWANDPRPFNELGTFAWSSLTVIRRPVRVGDTLRGPNGETWEATGATLHALEAGVVPTKATHADGTPIETPRKVPSATVTVHDGAADIVRPPDRTSRQEPTRRVGSQIHGARRMTAPLTLDERKALRRRAWWTVADFARYTSVSHWQAKTALARYDAALGGLLLKRSNGINRKYGFYWAMLAQQAPEAFLDNPIEQQSRLDAAEVLLEDMATSLHLLKAQVGWVSRELGKRQARRKRAA